MNNLKAIKGQLVAIDFLDHSIEKDPSKASMKFRVFGEVMSINSEHIQVRQWKLLNGDKATKKLNDEVAKILLSTIIDIKFMKLMEEAPGGQ